jgi:hypothetical protein
MSSAASDKKTVFGMPYNVGMGVLCVLGAATLYAFYSNVLAGPSGVSVPPPDAGKSAAANGAAAAPAIAMSGAGDEAPTRKPVSTQRRNTEEFNPPFHKKGTENRIDTIHIDPTLRLDLLAKVQAVELSGGTRNLFQMGPAPKPAELPKGPETIVRAPIGPRRPPEPLPTQTAAKAPDPPIQLKYYGLSTVVRNGKKTAFFMDGEDIVIAGEGEVVKRRYKVIRILATTVQVEDTEGKRTVTLPITEETPG